MSFTVEIADHIAHIRFNRPDKANSMTPEFWKELPEVVDRISNDAEARVIVISSEGKHFTAGMDISVFMSGSLDGDSANAHVSAEAFRYKIKALQETFSALERARQADCGSGSNPPRRMHSLPCRKLRSA